MKSDTSDDPPEQSVENATSGGAANDISLVNGSSEADPVSDSFGSSEADPIPVVISGAAAGLLLRVGAVGGFLKQLSRRNPASGVADAARRVVHPVGEEDGGPPA